MQVSGGGAAISWMLLAGLAVRVISGMLGIGGGVLVIPVLVGVFGFAHERAVGTSLGMLLPPIGIFAFLDYYRHGNVDLTAAGLLALGFAAGAFFGSLMVNHGVVPSSALRLM